jgi:hypothetical protein
MLAAASRDVVYLSLFKLVLSLRQMQEQRIPQPLEEQFNKIVNQAKQLAASPNQIQGDLFPEAIDLALEMRSVGDIARDVDAIDSLDSLTPQLAKSILEKMEAHPVYQA